jgi:hypothetical protein
MNANFHMLLSKAKLGCSSFKSLLLLYLTLDWVDTVSPCHHAVKLHYVLVPTLLNVQSIYLTIYRYRTSFFFNWCHTIPIMYRVA